MSPFLAILIASVGAAAEPPAQAPKEPEAHEEHTDNAFSARVLAGRAIVADEHVPLAGIGIAYERDIAHGLLAVEGALEWLAEPDGNAFLLELLVEKPIPITPRNTLYLGGGPVFVEHLTRDHAPLPGAGALMLVGLETVIVDHWELFLELDTAFLYADHPVVETDLGAGVMWRF